MANNGILLIMRLPTKYPPPKTQKFWDQKYRLFLGVLKSLNEISCDRVSSGSVQFCFQFEETTLAVTFDGHTLSQYVYGANAAATSNEAGLLWTQ